MHVLLQHHAPWQMCKASQHYNRPLEWWPTSTDWVHYRESYNPLAPETNHKSKFNNSLIFSTHIKYIILLLICMYILLCFVLHVILTCIRQEWERKWTAQQYSEGWLLYPTPSAKTLKTAYHKARWYHNTTIILK